MHARQIAYQEGKINNTRRKEDSAANRQKSSAQRSCIGIIARVWTKQKDDRNEKKYLRDKEGA